MSGGLHANLIRLEGKSSQLINVLRVNPKSLFYGGVSLINGIAHCMWTIPIFVL